MVEEEGAVTVPARLLTEFVSHLPDQSIDMDVSGESKVLKLKCARSEANINGTEANDFPPIPSVDEEFSAKIEPQVLRTAINQVVFAAATEESRPVLTGVKLELEESQFTMAAADGFRLAVFKGDLAEPVPAPVSIILPHRTLAELGRFLGEHDGMVEIVMTPSRGQALFRLENIEVVSQLIQGTFPNYSQLIPQTYQTRTIFDLQEFSRAARGASIFARDGNGIVRLEIMPEAGESATAESSPSEGKVRISARAEEMGENQDEINTSIEGEESKIAFNNKYLLDVLNAFERGEVALETTTSSSPGVFKSTTSDRYVHVVMPMFVQW
jgi:DNA polymerase-3 subunit beta